MREIKACPKQEWEQLPTQELDQILQAELEKEYPAEEVVLPILRILEEREKDYPVEKPPEILALLGETTEHDTSSKKSRNRRIIGITAIAAAICIVIMALPRTVGAESIFDVIFRWTAGIFEFIDQNGRDHPGEDGGFTANHPGLQQLYEKVTELGVEEAVVPMWLPAGFELESLQTTTLREGGYKVDAVFKGNGKGISIAYRVSDDITTKFEKERPAVEIFDSGGINHFVLENGENISVMWKLDGVECSLNTNVSKDDAYAIIKSIYRSKLPQ